MRAYIQIHWKEREEATEIKTRAREREKGHDERATRLAELAVAQGL